ncbi:MAG: hypothetical protein K2G16_10395, partial [Lachnospiraceae bacterium]|nr:hypothetical protein [Lachnospiraceae bacterium]
PEESTPNLWENRYKTPEVSLQKWVGHYHRSGNIENNGGLVMDFFLYEEQGQFYGYLQVEEWEYLEVEGENHTQRIKQRILTTVSNRGGEVFVYFYEDIPTELSEDFSMEGEREESYTGAYRRGDLLFSMKREGEDIITTWEKPFPDETAESPVERNFIEWDFLSCELTGEKDKEAFLAARGVQTEEPFFVYYDEDGTLLLTVYMDDPTEGGIGIYYFYSMGGSLSMQGFGIPACEEAAWTDGRFDVTKNGDNGDDSGVTDYEEGYEYNDEEQLVHFLSEGTITDMGEPYRDRIIEVTYSYREDGTLEKKEGFYNACVFGTTGCSETCFYDEDERLIHSYAYIT